MGSKKTRFALRVIKGGYAPADSWSASALRKRHRVGDLVFVEFSKPRNPGFHRLAHRLGELLAENLEPFENLDGHEVLKRLQIEANLGCDEVALNFPGVGPCSYRIPRSLSYESMSEDEFRPLIENMCKYVSKTYWPSCTAEKIESMADAWVEAA